MLKLHKLFGQLYRRILMWMPVKQYPVCYAGPYSVVNGKIVAEAKAQPRKAAA